MSSADTTTDAGSDGGADVRRGHAGAGHAAHVCGRCVGERACRGYRGDEPAVVDRRDPRNADEHRGLGRATIRVAFSVNEHIGVGRHRRHRGRADASAPLVARGSRDRGVPGRCTAWSPRLPRAARTPSTADARAAVSTGRRRALLSWSSGKDSAFALAELRRADDVEVVGLVTTINASFARVSMHGVREELLVEQAAAVGLPLWKVPLPWPCPNDAYEAAMSTVMVRARGEGIAHMAFGDLFLEEIRAYREERLAGTGITPLFPLWGRDTTALAGEMVAAGQRAVVVCVDPAQLDADRAGRQYDAVFLDGLPAGCDPCGERGEFHTFAWDGPAFSRPVAVTIGDIVERDGFVFADVLPIDTNASGGPSPRDGATARGSRWRRR